VRTGLRSASVVAKRVPPAHSNSAASASACFEQLPIYDVFCKASALAAGTSKLHLHHFYTGGIK
ncbi:MAG: hypothetical protein J5973_08725, partial [Eubacterium sp.]|nr:hypothetical protein [Eubacterium sp.]